MPTSRTGSLLTHSSSVRSAPPPYHGGTSRLPAYDSHDQPRHHTQSPSSFDYSSSDETTLRISQPWFAARAPSISSMAHRTTRPAQPQVPYFPPSPATSPEPERQMQSFAAGLRSCRPVAPICTPSGGPTLKLTCTTSPCSASQQAKRSLDVATSTAEHETSSCAIRRAVSSEFHLCPDSAARMRTSPLPPSDSPNAMLRRSTGN